MSGQQQFVTSAKLLMDMRNSFEFIPWMKEFYLEDHVGADGHEDDVTAPTHESFKVRFLRI